MAIKKQQIAVCYYPTTIIFLDDKKRFLSGLATNINKDIAYRPFASPHDTLEFIEKTHVPNSLTSSCFSSLKEAIEDEGNEELSDSLSAVDIDVSDIYKEVYNPKRFEKASVIVVDYAMPGMNGVEFAEKIKQLDPGIKVLMITGEADDAVAIEAFNEGLINRFIRKGSHTFYDEVNQALTDLQHEYFYDLSKNVVNNLAVSPVCCLSDSVFIEFFHDLCLKEKVCEYYLIDEWGSFLLLDAKANPSWLVIKSDQTMNEFYSIAHDSGAPKDIQKALGQREKVLFLFTKEDEYEPLETWNKYLHPAKELVGKKGKYYYTFIRGTVGGKINPKKIAPYSQYLVGISS